MTSADGSLSYIEIGDAGASRRIAVIATAGVAASGPSVLWLGGYRSDMSGTKAVDLEARCRQAHIGFVRFDYSGHGSSSGDYTDGTISQWLEEAMAVADTYATGGLVLVGSSMGGWIALRMVEELRKRSDADRLRGLVLIAPAPDFTAELIEPALTERERASLAERGYFEEASEYSEEPNRFTRKLIEDGRRNLVLAGQIATGCRVHILQGMKDPDVPYSHALKLMERIIEDDATMTLIRDGDHRLSRPEDLDRIWTAVSSMTQRQ